MVAVGPLSEPVGRSRVEPEMLTKCRAEVAKLIAQLAVVGTRLGTPDEAPGDLDLAQRLGHELRNQLCGVVLGEALVQQMAIAPIGTPVKRRDSSG